MSSEKDVQAFQAYQASVQATQKQILEGIEASHQWILEQVRAFASASPQNLPGVDKLAPPASRDQLDKMVDEAFDFSQKLLAAHRDFTHKLMAASAGRGGDESASGS